VQHRARLNEESTQLASAELQGPREAVLRLWQAVFSQGRP
jgi:hypothetical protein